MTLAGRVEGAVPWCDSTIGAWSADGQYLACGVPSRDTLRVGLAQPGSVPVHVPLPGALSGGPMWSPDGRFIAATIDAGGQRSLYLLDHEGEGRLLRVDRLEPMASLLGWVRQTRVHHAQRVAFDRDTLVIPVGQAARIPQPARTASGDTLRQPVAVRWAVEDTLIAHVGGSGLVTGDRPGVTRLIASLGPLLADTAVVIVEPRESQLVLHDQFEVGLDSNAWKPFGNPPPRTLRQRGRNGSTAFHNNGDGAWASGIVSRHTFSVRRGLTLEYLARTPWATGEWHALHVQLSVTPADSFRLSVEDPNPGARFLLSAFGPQVGEQGSPVRLASLSAGRWQGRRGLAPDGAYVIMPKRLLDGAWHRYRLVLYPTGEARWFADGAPLAPRIETGMEGVSRVALVIGGKSVNTLVLVDDVRLWEGVMLEPPLRRR